MLAVILTSAEVKPARRPIPATSAPVAPAPPLATATDTSREAVEENVDQAVAFCAEHVTTERSFVVFSNGTCVVVDEPCEEPVLEAARILDRCASPEARFITREIENGSFLVSYREPVFNCLFSDEIETKRTLLEEDFPAFLTAAERKSMPAGFNPPFHAKLGLLARFRLNHDARERTVAKIIRANAVAGPERQIDPVIPSEAPKAPEEPALSESPLPVENPSEVFPPLLPGA